ncbi:MAG: hypothetical protein ABI729_05555 [Chitinophagales bacterium]
MKKNLLLSFVLALMVASVVAQSGETKPAVIVESMYILPKKGMTDKMEAAVKAHVTKYHPSGTYLAGLRSIDYGLKSGWYVWVMGPTGYAGLDPRPDKVEHADDWNKNVDPFIEEYGATTINEYDADLSTGREFFIKSDHYDVWAINVQPGEMDRFNEILQKLSKTYVALGDRAFMVYHNMVHTPGGADVGIVTSFTNYVDFGKDWGVKQAYEKLYGVGSWKSMLTTWNEVVVDYNEELRSIVK